MLEPCWQRFTAAEGGARLASTVSSRNTLVTEYRSFIATRLLHEEAYSIRGSLSSGCQRSVRICRPVNVKPDAYELRILTDLEVAEATECDDVDDWSEELEAKEVLVCTSKVLKHILKEGVLTMCQINVLVIDSCHRIYEDGDLQYIMQVYKQQPHDKRPRILALTYPLFSATKKTIDNETSPENTVDNENAQENTTNNGTLRENTTDNEISERNDIDNKTQENATDNETSEGNATDNEVSEDNITDCKVNEQNSTHNEICEQNSEDNVQIFEENNINDDIKVECNKNENKENKNDFNDLNVYENLDDFEMYEKLEWRIEHLENELCCKMDLAEDIDGCKRISGTMTKPKELIIEYGTRPGTDNLSEDYITLETFMSECANETLAFLEDHRYDPTEIYGEDLYEELKNIPDPTTEPKQIFKQFLYVLQELGPYAGDKAAITLLSKIEKSKIRVPYERHFLLLRLCTTTFVKIRCYAELIFDKYTNDWDKIRYFSTPKLLRFVDILENFSPVQKNEGSDKDTQNEGGFRKISKMIRDIDSCDFKSVGNRIEDKLNTMEANLKDLDLEGTKGTIKEDNRVYSRGRVRAAYTASALCALVFVSHALMARILFMLCADLSRCKASLSYLRSQYCAAEPSVEQKECQKQGKKQEEVLKKFRMHECNLLLTTSALEEGIDLPRCNLVLRWDVPASYRSYSLSRSRGRAARATAAMLCDPEHSNTTLHNLAVYTELDQIITRKCGCGIQDDPSQEEEAYADRFTSLVKAYTPNDTKTTPCNRKTSPCSCIKSSCRTSTCICKKSSCICKPSPCICKKLFCSCKPSSCTCKTSSCTCSNKDELRKTTACVTKNESDANRNNDFRKNETSEINDCDETCESEINDFSEINDSEREINDVIETNESKTNNLCELLKNSNLNSENVVSNELCDSKTNECSKNIKSNAVGSTLSENIKNMRISKSLDSDKKCLCQNLEKAEHASVDLSTAIALINRYCAKLPSDTFTRLAPQWWIERVRLPTDKRHSYICTLRLPLNCPLKYNIVGHPMPTRVLARRMAALQACRILHKAGELDDQLMPIGKENFKAAELTTMNSYSVVINEREVDDFARPGTTKRRQYYYKRTASAFKNCQPVVDISDSELDPTANMESEQTDKIATDGVNKRNMLFAIECSLCCALPERYNTRGRRLHAPQHAASALAVLMGGTELTHMQIPSFPVYTRSGEVRVSVRHVPHADVTLTTRRNELVTRFMSFVFSDVLRVRRRGMTLQPEGSTKNNYYIVPTVKLQKEDGTTQLDIDWPFLELIYKYTEDQRLSDVDKPMPWYQKKDCNGDGDGGDEGDGGKRGDEKGEILDNPLLKKGEVFVFDVDRYREAVVTPWYRNQDQPQFFLVAEICWNLTPDSAFPSESHSSFRSYYRAKYKVNLTQSDQPLLDVDHTSARLNLLTPRYVNRKGVALPVSSERTRRAKRDRLDQKQILVPELCRVHPFAAPLWFATVALPCVLYRINALLIADEIRRAVAIDVGLGIPTVDENTMPGFNWPPLDFGWSLSEVLNADAEKNEKKKEEDREKEKERREKEVRELEVKKQSEVIEESIEEEIPMKTINDILQEKEDAESGFEIGTWSNDMASSIPDNSFDEYLEPLPPNLTLCTSASGGVNWCESVQKPQGRYTPGRVYSVADSDCSYISSDFDTDDSDFEDEESDEDTDVSGFCSSRTRNNAVGVRIEYKTAHEAEAVDVERKRKTHPAPERDVVADRQDMEDMMALLQTGVAGDHYITKFNQSVENHKKNIVKNKQLILKDTPIVDLRPDVVETRDNSTVIATPIEKLPEIFPRRDKIDIVDGQITIESIEKNKRVLLADLRDSLVSEEIKKLNCFSMVDVDIDSPDYVNEKIANIGFDSKETYEEKLANFDRRQFKPYYDENRGRSGKEYDFDYQPDLEGHPGPSPSVILQALTMSNANDGINLERLETIGDSFLKFAITAFLYCAHPTVHEGKLSHMRSKQVSNLNLYRLGRAKRLGARMIASKFEPHDNWLPPCHRPPPGPATQHGMTDTEDGHTSTPLPDSTTGCYIPYNLITQHSIPDKSIADCVEALIGAYLLECGPRGALLFMSWLGISVLPRHAIMLPRAQDTGDGVGQKCPKTSHKRKKTIRKRTASASSTSTREGSDGTDSEWDEMGRDWDEFVGPVGARRPFRDADGNWIQIVYGELKAPPSPLLRYIENPEGELEQMLSGYEALENTLQYRFRDRSLLLQALTHASHQRNRLTDCYQRLEFLGDAILDYLITRHLYEDPRRHCPGALTDLRSALVNNTIFATLAVRHGFHKYFRHMSPGLNEVLTKYVKIQEENGHSISEEHYLIQEDELEQAEDVEVPKALGDLFESVAGAIFLDAGMSLGAVWQSYVRLMGAELEAFSAAAPKSPVRELLEAEPDTAKFGKPERLADGRRVRVCVEVFGRGTFKGIGRNYRIAKGTAARCALRHLKGLTR